MDNVEILRFHINKMFHNMAIILAFPPHTGESWEEWKRRIKTIEQSLK